VLLLLLVLLPLLPRRETKAKPLLAALIAASNNPSLSHEPCTGKKTVSRSPVRCWATRKAA
jgi:hypothetical protein